MCPLSALFFDPNVQDLLYSYMMSGKLSLQTLQSQSSYVIIPKHVVGMIHIPIIRGGPLAGDLDMNALIRGEDEQDGFSKNSQ